MIGRRDFLIAVVSIATCSPTAGRAGDAGAADIERLLGAVQSSPCEFFRNGARYAGPEAADHLRKKWRYAARGTPDAMTAAQFIARVASVSSMTGQPYLVDCGSGPQPLSAWLTDVLLKTGRP